MATDGPICAYVSERHAWCETRQARSIDRRLSSGWFNSSIKTRFAVIHGSAQYLATFPETTPVFRVATSSLHHFPITLNHDFEKFPSQLSSKLSQRSVEP